MKPSNLFIQSLVASIILAVTIWSTLGAPPHQNGKAQFNLAMRR